MGDVRDGINLRARFPDGNSLTLRDVCADSTYDALLRRLRAHTGWTCKPCVLVAGPPPAVLVADGAASLKDVVPSGSLLIVEPHADEPATAAASAAAATRGRGRGWGRGRERGLGRGRGRGATVGGRGAANVQTLSGVRSGATRRKAAAAARPGDWYDDKKTDADWDAREHADDGKRSAKRRVAKRQCTAPARDAKAKGTAVSTGAARVSSDSKMEDAATAAVELGLAEAQGRVGESLAQCVAACAPRGVVACELRGDFANALDKRRAEAEGERRYGSYMGKRYELTVVDAGLRLTVRYRGLTERAWTREGDGASLLVYPKRLIVAVVAQVAGDAEDRVKLRPLEMAGLSPRLFWNMVKWFPDSIEDGLRELMPDMDWGFLEQREKTVSVRGRRNLENKRDMGWTSD